MKSVVEAEAKRCPISFDQHSAEHAANWPAIYADLRTKCPRAWTDSYDGFWVASNYRDIVDIAQSTDSISTHKSIDPTTGEIKGGVTIPPFPGTIGVPNEIDSPEWDMVRSFLNRRFSPKAAEQRRARAREIAAGLIDKVIESGRIDFVDDLTSPLPGIVTLEIFGFPIHEWKAFSDPVHTFVSLPRNDPGIAVAAEGIMHFRRRVDEEIAARRENPTDDFLSYLAHGTIDGEPLTYERIQEIAWQIMSGGVDTSGSVSANALLHLGRHPEQRMELAGDQSLIPRACEEFVRYFTPIQGAGRNVKHDTTIAGWDLAQGDRVLMAYASGNRDPAIFPDAEQVILNRAPNPHVGFGAGQHRCLGAFLARVMFQELLKEVLERIPDFTIVEGGVKAYPSIGFVNGLVHLPATFAPGRRVGIDLAI